MIFVKGNLIKLGVAALAAVIIIGVVAALVSGFMTAFKPESNATSSTTGYSGGAGGGGGRSSVAVTPAVSPMPVYGSPAEMPPPAMVPEDRMQVPYEPASGQISGLTPQQDLQSPYPADVMPPEQPQAGGAGESGAGGTRFSGESPVSFPGSGAGSWFNVSPSGNATPITTPQPVPTSQPVVMPPVSGPRSPDVPAFQLAPYEQGWQQVIMRLLELLPLMFPGYFPGLQWYEVPSAY
ncbi:hypothetical protein [Methanocella sp. MCL-LM]|uniref:hypothetical protein n=1 Tax=Methanocella sp. MCL-LM TaxID=3412035 RepID=UPI003C71A7B0